MNELIKKLIISGPVITDGALGTQLQLRGLPQGELGDAWNLTCADRVESVTRAYVEAGSQVILTNTFRSNRIALSDHGLAEKVVEMNHRGVEIALRASEGRAHVFGSIGPSGKMLIMGNVCEDEMLTSFSEQARALAKAGAEAIVIETMSDLIEAQLAIRAARVTELPVIACMTFETGTKKDRTMMEVTPEEAAIGLTEAGADVIGANCGVGIFEYVSICKRLQSETDKPIWIKPNAGLPEVSHGRIVYRTTPEQFASHTPALLKSGANFIGGCCGTGPEYIKAIKKELRV